MGFFPAAPAQTGVNSGTTGEKHIHNYVTYIVFPMTSAIFRHICIVVSNAAGVKVCEPSLTAFDGLGWTSMMSPSAPAAIEAADIDGTNEAIPVPWLGSTTIGKC